MLLLERASLDLSFANYVPLNQETSNNCAVSNEVKDTKADLGSRGFDMVSVIGLPHEVHARRHRHPTCSFACHDTGIARNKSLYEDGMDVVKPEEHQYGKTQVRLDAKEATAPLEKGVLHNSKPQEPVITELPPVEYFL